MRNRHARSTKAVLAASMLRRTLAAAVTVSFLGMLTPYAAHAHDAVGSIGLDEDVFWSGPATPQTAQVKPEECDTERCWIYHLNVTEPGWRLRIGLDLLLPLDVVHDDADAGRSFRLEVFPPDPTGNPVRLDGSGNPVATPLVSHTSDYSAEIWICATEAGCLRSGGYRRLLGSGILLDGQVVYPALAESPGVWTIRVIPTQADQWTFRMRAKLEDNPGSPAPQRQAQRLLPNLRSMEPFEFTFTAPATDVAENPQGVGGTPISCTASEYRDGALTCLRFTGGPSNDGQGHFQVQPCHTPENVGTKVKACQRIYFSDDSTTNPHFEDRDTGWHLVFDDSHGHWHYEGFLTYELFRVTDLGRNKLAEIDAERKTGFCPIDERIIGFSRFYQGVADTQNHRGFEEGFTICNDPVTPAMGLTAGWGDYYEWQRPGQFVDFQDPASLAPKPYDDGAYVVRSTVDKDNRILESDENDNSSYAYICVAANGTKITLLKHGFGDGPAAKPSDCV